MCRWADAYPESYWDSHTIVAQYLVTMDIQTADPLLPIDGLVEVVREAILPSLEALTNLKARGKVVTGGYPEGERFLVMVVEADSEEELQEVLDELPLSDVAKVKATPLRGFGELRGSR
jgi:muconolactone delta-isomerase